MPPLTFEIRVQSADCDARLGCVTTPHGSFDTPAFMPVGTQGAVKGLAPDMVAALATQVILANTYHLMLRPGAALVAEMGGLHDWMRWAGPILTDSGGYQVFSLADINTITDEGVTFRSHVDGAIIELTPQRSIALQNELGADIIMALDDCPPAEGRVSGVGCRVSGTENQQIKNQKSKIKNPPPPDPRPQTPDPNPLHPTPELRIQQACERSVRWLDACIQSHARSADQALFGIVQGGTDLERRRWCVERTCCHDLPGFAIGGVAVGEGHDELQRVVRYTVPLLPAAKPRYLMGVGYERDILTAVQAGVDMFDCVLPTRNGRSANAFTPTGQIRLRNHRFARDAVPIDPDCDCPACRGGYSRSYLRHLFQSGEMLGPILVSAHNIRHFQRLLLDIRLAIAENDWSPIGRRWPIAMTDRPQATRS